MSLALPHPMHNILRTSLGALALASIATGCVSSEFDTFSEDREDSTANYQSVEVAPNSKFRPLTLRIPYGATDSRFSAFTEVTSTEDDKLTLSSRDIRIPLYAADETYLARNRFDTASAVGIEFSVRERNEEEEWSEWTIVPLPNVPKGSYFAGIINLDKILIDSQARTITGPWVVYGSEIEFNSVVAPIPATKQYMELRALTVPLLSTYDFEAGALFESEWDFGIAK